MATVYMNSHSKQIGAVNNTTEEFPPRLAQPRDEARGRLWQYILAFFAGTVLVGTLTGFHILEKEKAAIAYWQDQEWTIVDDRARQISNWLGERRADTELLSSYLSVQQLLRPVEKSGSSGVFQTSVLEPLSVLLDQFAFTRGYAGIYLMSLEGRVVAQSANLESVSPAVIERARMVSQGNAFWVGPLGETQANSSVYFISPIFAHVGAGLVPALGDHKGRPYSPPSPSCLGVLALQIDPKRSLLPILMAERVATRSGETLLLRREGNEVIFLSPLRGAPLIQGFLRRSLSVLTAETGREGKSLSGESLDYRGVPVLSAERRIPLTDWILVSKIDRDEALEDFYQRARLEAMVGACLVLVFAYVLVGYRRKMLARALEERVAHQQAILAILAFAQQMVDNVPAGLLILSPDLNVLSANRTFLEAFHQRPEEVIGRPLPEVVQAEGPPRRIMGATGPSSGPHDVLVDLAAPGGIGTRPARLTLTQISNEQGKGRLLLTVEDLTESERLRTAAEASERRLRELVQSIDAIVWEAEAKTHQFTFVSQRAEQILGYPVGQWLSQADFWEQHLHPLDREQAVGARRQAIAEGRDHSLEYRVLAADGREVWLHDTIHVVLDAEGRPIQLRGVAIDSTKGKLAEEALRASEEKYRLLFAGNLAGVFYANLDGAVLDCNDALVRILGYDSCQELLGRNVWDFFSDPADREQVSRALRQGKALANFEEPVRRKDGSSVWLLMNARLMEGPRGQPAIVQATLIDITERKQAEAERMLLMTAIEQSADGIVITDAQGTIQYVNPAFSRVSGYSREEALGKNPRILKSGKQDEAYYGKLWTTILGGEIWQDEIINRRSDGSLYPEQMTITPVRDQRGEITHFIAIKAEVTERKRLEQQLRQAQKMEAVGRLAGGVAHDFNNLLTIISGYGGLLLEHPGTVEPLRGYVNEIKNASGRAASLTRQLLAFSRQQVLAPRVLGLNAVVANIEKMLKRLIGEDIDLVTILGESLWPVKADPGQLEQVLLNLAVNARDAMPNGGVLTIETANVEMDSTSMQSHFPLPPGRYVLLAISDTGIGMDAETQARIFDPFFTTKEKGKGTGLGLAMVYGIVKQSGGYIWVYSEVGKGTTFKIYLPRTEEEVDESGPGRSGFKAQQGTETLLLVEDEDAVRALVRNVLREKGYRILEASRGEEALELAEQYGEPIDLLLTDVVMPQMNGRELARRLANLLPQIKVLYISGYADNALWYQGGLDSGGAFLQKPFSPEALARKVREVLGGPPHRRS
jgi:PAS domain S-box-containing protein